MVENGDGKWLIVGGWEVILPVPGGGTEAQTASARTVVPMSQKILDFYMKFT